MYKALYKYRCSMRYGMLIVSLTLSIQIVQILMQGTHTFQLTCLFILQIDRGQMTRFA